MAANALGHDILDRRKCIALEPIHEQTKPPRPATECGSSLSRSYSLRSQHRFQRALRKKVWAARHAPDPRRPPETTWDLPCRVRSDSSATACSRWRCVQRRRNCVGRSIRSTIRRYTRLRRRSSSSHHSSICASRRHLTLASNAPSPGSGAAPESDRADLMPKRDAYGPRARR